MRNITLSLLVTFLLCLGAGTHTIIQQEWKFKTGDDPAWSAIDYDDTKWQVPGDSACAGV